MAIQKFNNDRWESAQDPLYTDRPPEPFYSTNYSRLLTTATVGGGLFASGFISTKTGNVWDKYVSGLQHLEEYSPGGILRTFQLSTFFSQFKSLPKEGLFVSPQLLQQNNNYRQYLGTLIGQTQNAPSVHNRLIAEGVTLKNNKLFWGNTEEVALPFASALREESGVISRIGAGYAQALDFTPKGIKREQFFSNLNPLDNITNPAINDEVLQIIGGHSRTQATWRQISAIGAESVNRFNRLLEAPFELEPFKTVFNATDNLLEKHTNQRIKFAVNQTTPLKQLGNLGAKYGLALGTIGLGYSTLDWLVREFPLFDPTIFSEGITAGVATAGVYTNLAASKFAEITGLHAYREAQEDTAPGSTSLQKILAIPLAGAIFGSASSYLLKLPAMAKLQKAEGLSPAAARQHITESMAEFGSESTLSKIGKNFTTTQGFYQRDDWIGKTLRTIAKPGRNNKLHFKLLGEVGPVKLTGLLGAAAGFAAIIPFLPGALIPSTRPDELSRIYSGEQEVAVKKGRYWEFGRQPYEGEGIKYFRPHWYPRMIQRSKDKAIWGEDVDDAPWSKFLRKEFTYELEEKHYADRPYPISALPFYDIPLIGPLLANTIGRIIKPPVLMHEEEWSNSQTGDTLIQPSSFGTKIKAIELGEKLPAQPISPYAPTQVASEQIYRLTEMTGLPGYVSTLIKEGLTGSPDFFDQYSRLESANRIAGFERDYWDLELGGVAGTSEVFRRLYPHKQNQIPLYNPIKNQMPDWLPGSGERGPDLQHGDPFCTSKDTLIETKEGFKCAAEITTKDIILTHKGNWTPIAKIIKRPLVKNEKAYSLSVAGIDSKIPLEFSEEHPILSKKLKRCRFASSAICRPEVRNNFIDCDLTSTFCTSRVSNPEFIPISDLQIGDAVAYPIWNKSTLLQKIPYSYKIHLASRLPPIKEEGELLLDEALAWLLGVYVAEGSTGKNKSGPQQLIFSLNSNEKEFANKIVDNIQTLSNKEPIFNERNNSLDIIYCDARLARIINSFIPGNLYEKRVPQILFSSPRNVIWAFLAGILEGDGSYQRNELIFECANELLTKDIFHLANGAGIPISYIARNNRLSWGFSIHTWHIKDMDMKWLLNKKPSLLFTRQPNIYSWSDDNYVYRLVTNIVNIELDYVFGFQVDIDDSFCVFGIATHNTKIQEGELRLPGPGYAARFSELEGIDPKDYPLIHRYKILADVAPYTDKFKQHASMVRAARKGSDWTEQNESIYQATQQQLEEKRRNKTFYQYQALGPLGEIGGGDRTYYQGKDDSTGLLEQLNRIKTENRPSPSLWKRFFGGYWEALAHNAETPFEYLTPISPAAKLIHMRSPIESYEKDVVYGTQNAFWNKPYENFLRPAKDLFLKEFGDRSIPEHVESQRKLEEYFDVLKYAKASRLANQTALDHNFQGVREQEQLKNETLFGMNPFTQNPRHIYRALPKRDKDYFEAFSNAETVAERERILSLVPENQQALYKAQWQNTLAEDIKIVQENNLLSEAQNQKATQTLESIQQSSLFEGMPVDETLAKDYQSTKGSRENYADWYRRTKLLPKHVLPAADWIGWDPRVELEDVKLKVVLNMGEDMHDYNLWEDRLRAMANKPFIDDIMIKPILNQEDLSDTEKQARINNILLLAEQKQKERTNQRTIINIEQDRDFKKS